MVTSFPTTKMNTTNKNQNPTKLTPPSITRTIMNSDPPSKLMNDYLIRSCNRFNSGMVYHKRKGWYYLPCNTKPSAPTGLLNTIDDIAPYDKWTLRELAKVFSKEQLDHITRLRGIRRSRILRYEAGFIPPGPSVQFFRPYGDIEYYVTEIGLVPVRPPPWYDLTQDGIEPNPGPVDTGHAMYYCQGGAVLVQVTSSNLPEVRSLRTTTRYRTTFRFLQNTGSNGYAFVQWNNSANSQMAAGGIRVPNQETVEVWTAGPFEGLRVAAVNQMTGTLIYNMYEYNTTPYNGQKMNLVTPLAVTATPNLPVSIVQASTSIPITTNQPLQANIVGTVPVEVQGLPKVEVANTVGITAPLPVPIIAYPSLDVNVKTPVTVTTLTPIDVNVKDSVPVELAAGDLAVSINPDSLPVWVTSFGRDPEVDITVCGDVEKNPGPTKVSQPALPLEVMPQQMVDRYVSDVQSRDDWKPRKRPTKLGVQTASVFIPDKSKDGDVETNPGPQTPKPLNIYPIMDDHEGIYGEVIQLESAQTPLTEDGWDMDRIKQRISKLATMKNKVGSFFRVAAYYCEIETSNYFSSLAVDIETLVSDVPEPEEKATVVKPKQTTPPKKSRDDLTQLDKPRKPQIVAIKQMVNVVARIVAKIKANMDYLPIWLNNATTTKFKRTVCSVLFGEDWEAHTDMDQYEMFAYCHLNDVPVDVALYKYASFDNKWIEYAHCFANFRADSEAAKLHNKVMHAFNGNVLSKNMKDVDEAPAWQSFMVGKDNAPLFTGIEAQIAITNVDGDQNPNITNLFFQDRLRGNYVTSGNAISHNAVFPLPTTNMIPTQSKFFHYDPEVPEAIPYNYYGIPITEMNTADYYNYPIRPTELSETLSNQVKNNQTSNWRRDNTTLPGFSTFDLASVNTTLTPKGLSLESMLLKLDMLHSIVSLRSDYSQIPGSLWGLGLDLAQATPDNATLHVNNVDGQDELDSGGSQNPQFPWFGGTGQLAFHLTLQSVDIADRNDAIFLPPGLLQASYDAQMAIALFIISWAEWPFCIYSYAKDVVLTNLTNPFIPPPFTGHFLPTQTLTRVPGMRKLNIILPRRYAEANPTTQQAANAQSLITPMFGPVGTAHAVANAPININFVGQGQTQYVNLTDYLVTWAAQVDITSIKQYLGRLGVMVGVADQLNAVRDINIATCQLIPSMAATNGSPVTTMPSATVILEDKVNTTYAPWITWCYTNHTQVSMAVDYSEDEDEVKLFPILNSTPADFRIFQTDIAVWNKVCNGLATADNLMSEQLTTLPPYVGDARTSFWERLQAIPMVASWAVYYALTGITAAAWDQGYSTSENKWIQNRVRHTFCTEHQTGTILPAKYAILVRRLMQNMFDRSPALIKTNINSLEITLSHFERWLPTDKFAKVYIYERGDDTYDVQEFNGFVPTLLPDIWVQYLARKLPQFMMSFPPPMGEDSTQGFGFGDGLLVHRNNNKNIAGPFVETDVRGVYPITEGPTSKDKIKWNERIWLTQPNRAIGNYAGEPILEPLPPNGWLPMGRVVPLYPGEQYPTEILNQSTTCLPQMSSNGSRILPYLPIPASILPVQACNRAARLDRAAMLIQGVLREPSLQAIGYAKDIFDDFLQQPKSDFTMTTASDNIVARTAETARQAVDPATLPSSEDPSTSSAVPAPTNDSTN